MSNDDPEYVRDLERSVRSMEIEIRVLEQEVSEKNRIIADLQNALNPTYMGEPLIRNQK